MMTLYHGSNVEIHKIIIQKNRSPKDFGQGFYLSDNLQQARNFARYKADKPKSETHEQVVTRFEFNDAVLYDDSLRIKRFDGYNLDWIQFVKDNRKGCNKDYDIVIGPIANDDVKTQFAKHIMGEISEEELMESLKWKHCTYQYCFITPAAIAQLTPKGTI